MVFLTSWSSRCKGMAHSLEERLDSLERATAADTTDAQKPCTWPLTVRQLWYSGKQ